MTGRSAPSGAEVAARETTPHAPRDPAEQGVPPLHESHAGQVPAAPCRETLGELATYLAISDRERRTASERAKPHAAVALGGALSGARVLDAGAGQGSHARELASRYDVLGIEAEYQFVEVARRRGGPRGPRFAYGDVAALRLPERAFDVALSLNTSLGYGDEQRDVAALEGVARALRPGACLVLETVSAGAADAARPTVRRLDEALVTTAPDFDPVERRLAERQELLLPAGRAGVYSYRVRAYDPPELFELLREAGFDRVRLYGSFDRAAWREGDGLLAVARTPHRA